MLSKLQLTIAPREPLLIGVSGGADSVALLDALVQLGYRPHICHLNHQLRGAASDADAEFVRQLAQSYNLPVTIESHAVAAGEDAARQARLEFFQSVAERTGLTTLALAHTADDQVETFLLRLLRGAGAAGLIGIWPERQIGTLRVIRPLLKIRRAEVLEYLKERKLMWREDASNADTRFARNRIRHELLPLLEREYNPAIRDVLLRTAEILTDDEVLLANLATAVPVGDTVDVSALRAQPVALQRRVLRLWLETVAAPLSRGAQPDAATECRGYTGQITFEHIEFVRMLEAGGEVTLPGGLIVAREYDTLRKVSRQELGPVRGRWALNPAGETIIGELGARFVLECADPLALSERQSADKPSPTRRRCRLRQSPHSTEEQFDADALGTGLFVRTWEEGDRFQPLGMTGEKKLQDFFVDEKVPRRQRGRVPLLCAADGRIAWVVGYRIAEPCKVTPATRRVLRARFQG